MMPSTMLQSKILKTRKRLSDDRWSVAIATATVMGLITILTFALRVPAVSWSYGVIPAELPVMSVTVDDPAYKTFRETAGVVLDKTTPAIAVSATAFYFGDLQAFTEDLLEVRNKFAIKHEDGQPQLRDLIKTMETWLSQKAEVSKGVSTNKGVVVLIPSSEIPVPIIMQIIAGIRSSGLFKRVVLAGGLK